MDGFFHIAARRLHPTKAPAQVPFFMPHGRKESRMEETKTDQTPTEELHSEEETDWKAESRKWEARAKKNSAAAEELEKLKLAQMSEQEQLKARAEKAEARIAELEAEALRKATAQRLSAEKHIPIDLLLFCATEEDMERFAETYSAQPQTPSAPSAPASRIQRGEGKRSNADIFSEFFHENFNS